MANNWFISGIQIVAGAVLTAVGLGTIGVPLLISGGLQAIAGLITAKGESGFDDSPTYGAVRVTNHRGEGERIPFVFGEHLQTPLCISTMLDTGTDGDVIERVYLLGFGPMKVYETTEVSFKLFGRTRTWYVRDLIDRITLNRIPLKEVDPEAFTKTVTTAAGVDLGKISGFNRSGQPFEQTGTQLGKGDEHLYTMDEEADAVHVVFDWPSGLYGINSKGELGVICAGVRFEYRLHGTDTYKPVDLGPKSGDQISLWDLYYKNGEARDKSTLDNPDWRVLAPYMGVTSVAKGSYYAEGNSRSAVRRVAKITFPEKGKYDIRLTGLFDQTATRQLEPKVSLMIEVNDQPVTTLEGVELLAVRFRAGSQFSGVEPVLRCRSLGMEIEKLEEVASGVEGHTDNAISCLYALLRHDAGSLGLWIPESVYGTTWKSLAQTIEGETFSYRPEGDSKSLTEKVGRCNIVVDTGGSATDWANRMLMLFRGYLYESQGKLEIGREAVQSSVRTFEGRPGQSGRYNIVRDDDDRPLLEVYETPRRERYNSVSVRYADRDQDWEQRTTIPERSSSAVGDTEAENRLDWFLPGATLEIEALKFARYVLDKAQKSVVLARWAVAWGDLDLMIGERVTVYAEHPQWAGDVMDFAILDIEYGLDGNGWITGRQYDATIWSGTLDSDALSITRKASSDQSKLPGSSYIVTNFDAPGVKLPAASAAMPSSGAGGAGGAPSSYASDYTFTIRKV